MWSIAGAIALLSFIVSPVGQRIVRPALTSPPPSGIIQTQ